MWENPNYVVLGFRVARNVPAAKPANRAGAKVSIAPTKAVKTVPDAATKVAAGPPTNKPAPAPPAPLAKGSPEEQLKCAV